MWICHNRCICICENEDDANILRKYGYNFYKPILSKDLDINEDGSNEHLLYRNITLELLDAYKSYYDVAFNYERIC